MMRTIYRCAECGRAITDEEYLQKVSENELKFCSLECVKTAWRRGVYEYAQKYNKKPRGDSTLPTPKKPRGRRDLTNEDRVEILELAEKGYSPSKISTITGRAKATVQKIIDNYELVYEDA